MPPIRRNLDKHHHYKLDLYKDQLKKHHIYDLRVPTKVTSKQTDRKNHLWQIFDKNYSFPRQLKVKFYLLVNSFSAEFEIRFHEVWDKFRSAASEVQENKQFT